MNYVEAAIIALILVSVGIQVLLARATAAIMRQGVDHLDHSLAEAIKTTVENLPGSLAEMAPDPVNPIHALVDSIENATP